MTGHTGDANGAPRVVHPIEAESYRIVAERTDLDGLAPGPAAVVARVVHATAEPSLGESLVIGEDAVEAGIRALRAGAPVVCDVEMVRAGITGVRALCGLSEVTEAGAHPSRSAHAMARTLARHPTGAVVVVSCAPTALDEVTHLLRARAIRPALVVAVPVGYVGASESKDALTAAAHRRGVPAIALPGERGGAAVGAAIVNALARLAGVAGATESANAAARRDSPGSRDAGLLLIGHGTRSADGEAELRSFVGALGTSRPEVPLEAGFIEFVSPGIDEALDTLVARGTREVVAVPLVLLGAGHMKDDGPAALARARTRHPDVTFSYARDLGLHHDVLAIATERAADAVRFLPGGEADAVVVVGRGSTDPDANADLVKAVRLLADGRGLGRGLSVEDEDGHAPATPALGLVEPAFISLARPDLPSALTRCRRLGATRIVVLPYFLFTGVLPDRITEQTTRWAAANPATAVVVSEHLGVDPRLVRLAWSRFDEALNGPVHMNCDGCLYRAPLPGYEHRLGAAPLTVQAPGSPLAKN